jgi:hypothetical protein
MIRNMLIRYRLARRGDHGVLNSLRFALFNRRPPKLQKQTNESVARLKELKRKWDEN